LELTAHPANHQYQWSTGGAAQSIYVTSAGTYFVTVINEYGCTATASVVVTNNAGGGLDGGGGSCRVEEAVAEHARLYFLISQILFAIPFNHQHNFTCCACLRVGIWRWRIFMGGEPYA